MTFALKHKSTNKSYIPAIKNICRLVIISILASFIVSLTSVLCIDFNFSSFITLWIVSTCILFGSLYLIQARPSSKNPKYKIFNNKLYKYIVRKKQNRILTVILLAILLAILWVPFIAGSAPFYTNVDTIDQIRQIYSVDEWISFTNPPIIEFNNHHPVLDSVIYSLFYAIGLSCGQPSLGFLILAICQIVVLAFILGYFIYWIFVHTRSLILSAFSIIFFGVLPFVPHYLFVIYKDTTTLPFQLIWLIQLMTIIISIYENKRLSRSFFVLFTIMAVIASLTKKTNIYLILLSMIIILIYCFIKTRKSRRQLQQKEEKPTSTYIYKIVEDIVYKENIDKNSNNIHQNKKDKYAFSPRNVTKNKFPSQLRVNPIQTKLCPGEISERVDNFRQQRTKTKRPPVISILNRTSSALYICFMVFIVVELLIYPICNIEPGSIREALSLPLQQLSYIVVNDSDDITEQEEQIIDAVIPYDDLDELYHDHTVDYVKEQWKNEATLYDTVSFVGLWLLKGIQYPDDYFNALTHIRGFFLFNKPPSLYSFSFLREPLASLYTCGAPIGNPLPFADDLVISEYDANPTGVHYMGTFYQTANQHNFSQNVFYANPLMYYLGSIPIYVVIIPVLSLAIMLAKRKYKHLLFFVPFFIEILILVASPMALPRYCLLFLFATPLIISIPFIKFHKKNKRKK